jgi:protein required for attachment to host cells
MEMFSYVVVADGGQARLLRVNGPARARHVVETEAVERPSLHAVTTESGAATDSKPHRPPRGRAGQSELTATTPHDTSSDYDPRAGEVIRFARFLSRRLDQLRQGGDVRDFILLAEPQFLGLLRKQLTEQTRQMVSRELPRDFVHADAEKILAAAFPVA